MDLIGIMGIIAAIGLAVVLMWFVGKWMIWDSIRLDQGLTKMKTEAKRRAQKLKLGERYHLTDKPHPADIEIGYIYEDRQWIAGKLVVTLPQGAEVQQVYPVADGHTIVFVEDGVWKTETWVSTYAQPLLFQDFWKVAIRDIWVVSS